MSDHLTNTKGADLPIPHNAFREKVFREAERLIAEGRTPIRLDARSKSPPTNRGKKKLTHDDNKLSQENIRERLATEDFNLGVMLGKESGNLIDYDGDWPEFRKIAAEMLSHCPAFGRAGARGSHRLATSPGAKSKKYTLPGGIKDDRLPSEHALCVGELRAKGLTMVPPSVHPNGETIEWEAQGELPELSADEAQRIGGRIAFLAVLLRFWPKEGARDDTAMAAAGALLSAEFDVEEVDHWVRRVAELAGDEEWQKRGKAQQTQVKIEHGEAVTGLPRLFELLGLPSQCVATSRDWLGIARDASQAGVGKSKVRGQNSIDVNRPYEIAQKIVEERFSSQGERALSYYNGDFYPYKDGVYRAVEITAIRSAVYRWLAPKTVFRKGVGEVPIDVTPRLVTNVIDGLQALCLIERDEAQPPCWTDGVGLPTTEFLVLQNGNLHLPTGALTPHTPRLFTLSKIGIRYDADAPKPVEWLAFLNAGFTNTRDVIPVLQEVMGYMLASDTSLQKAFMLIGPPRCGKSTIAKVIEWLVGSVNYAGIQLKTLGDQFGRQSLIPKQVAVVSDARVSKNLDRGGLMETVLSITGEDSQTIDRKNQIAWEGRLGVRIMIIGNELPQFTDASGAFASRFILMTTDVSFLGKEDPTLADRLKAELPGILLWAIEGWKRLKDRGRFLQPESSRASMRHFEFSSSPLTAFVEDCCVLDPEATIGKDVLYNAYTTWQQSEGRDFKMDKQTFATKLYAAFYNQISDTRPRKDGGRSSMFKGIRLKDKKELEDEDM